MQNKNLKIKIAAGMIFVLLPVILLFAAEFFVGTWVVKVKRPILPPKHSVGYHTEEFSSVSTINTLGFRGTLEQEPKQGQIITIGDSSTYGWGIPLDATWQARLEKRLRDAGVALDVYNLGKPGADPEDYVDIARTYMPLLKPKLVILALVQGDDLAQLWEKKQEAKPISLHAREILIDTFPALVGLSRSFRNQGEADATKDWGTDSIRLINQHSLKLDAATIALAEKGSISPGVLLGLARDPKRLPNTFDNAQNLSYATAKVAAIIENIRDITEKHGGKLVILSMPLADFADSKTFENHRKLGFVLPDAYKTSTIQDDVISDIARSKKVTPLIYTDRVREANKRKDVWFPLDGHMTVFGNDVLGEALFPDVMAQLTAHQGAAAP